MFKQVRMHDAILKFYQRSQPIAFSNAETLYDDLVLLRDQILMYGDLSEAQTNYLNSFIDKFDTNLYTTITDIFIKWLGDGFLSDFIRDLVNEEVIESRDGEPKLKLRLLRDKQNNETQISALKEKDVQFILELEQTTPKAENANKQVETARGPFIDLATRLNASDDELESVVADINTKLGELGSNSTFKGSATNAEILAKVGMQVGDEWFDTTNQQGMRWNGTAWVVVGGSLKLGERVVKTKHIDGKSVTPAQLTFSTNKASVRSTNLFSKDSVIVGEYVRSANGTYGIAGGFCRSEMITVVPGEKLTIAIAEQISFKDSLYNYVSGLTFTEDTQTITVPEGVKYMEINTQLAYLNEQQINRGTTLLEYETYYPKVSGSDIGEYEVSPSNTTFFDIPTVNLIEGVEVVSGQYVRAINGTIGVNVNVSYFGVRVKRQTRYVRSHLGQIAYFDDLGNYISGVLDMDVNTDYEITTPPNATIAYINVNNTDLDQFEFKELSHVVKTTLKSDFIPDITPNDTTFFDIPPINLFVGAEISNFEYVRGNNGTIGQNVNTLYFKTKVTPQTTYNRSHLGQIAYFDELGNYISGVLDADDNTDYQVTTPSNATMAYINVFIIDRDQYYFRGTSTATKVALKSEFLPESVSEKRISSIMSQLLLSVRALNIKIIGDSITAGVGGTGYATDGEIIYGTYRVNTSGYCWANSLKEYYESKFNVTVKNFGVSGRNSGDLLTNIGQIIHANDDIIICMIGTNDRNNESRDGVLNSKQIFYNNLKGIYDHVKSRGKEIIFMSNIPASVANENLDRIFHMEDVDMVVNKFASDSNIEYVSLYKLFIDYCKNNGIEIDSLLNDGLHPNDSGYDVMFYLITNALGIGVKRDGANW